MIDPTLEAPIQERPGVCAWNLMSEIWKSCKPWIEEVATSFGLTPQQLIAMKVMGEFGTMTMSELAQHLGCDASNVTSIVDRLQDRGFVERRPSEQDRRVKSLVMTPTGTALHASARDQFHQPPPVIDNLPLSDQEALCAIFRRALDGTPSR